VLGLVVQRAGDLGDQVEDGLVDEAGRLEDEGVEVCVDGLQAPRNLVISYFLVSAAAAPAVFAALPIVLRLVVSVMLTS
jgi:hypothetical protein